jgi:hypothetical protein
MREIINIILRRISIEQDPNGFWPSLTIKKPAGRDPETLIEKYDPVPDTHLTALCSLLLLKLSNSDNLRQKGKSGAKWLLEKQESEGYWVIESMGRKNHLPKPDIFTTVIALNALARSQIENINHSMSQGIEWLKEQQNELGLWDDNGFPFPFLTVITLEFFQTKEYYKQELTNFQFLSKGFLKRSIQFSLEEDSNSQQLAIISAFHGIEAFLYSILSHETINVKIFKDKEKTIGYRKALIEFQNFLQNKGEIKKNEVLPYRNSLDRLAYLRDQIVHKGLIINKTESYPLIKDAQKFLSLFSLKVFNFDVFA